MVKFLHSMIRVTNLDATIAFFKLLGLEEVKRREFEDARFTLAFLAAPGQKDIAEVELTYNWPAEDGTASESYGGGRNFGHLAYEVDDIYATCKTFADAGILISRPPRDGHMAFVLTPDGISIELLQKGESLAAAEPWASMENTGQW